MRSFRISVVVPTYKRPRLLERCLNALTRQSFDPDLFEVIIVDNAGCDETHNLVEEYSRMSNIYRYLAGEIASLQPSAEGVNDSGRKNGSYAVALLSAVRCPRVKYLRATEPVGLAAARNAGWRVAQGEIIAFTNDDCIPDPDWLTEGVMAFDEGTAGVSGWIEVQSPIELMDSEHNVSPLTGCAFLTANCFYRRNALEKVDGFDERFSGAWQEDTDLYFSMLKRSYLLKTAPEAIVSHPIRRASWGIRLKQQQKSMYNALLYKKHTRLYRRYVQPGHPLEYYIITLCAFLGILSLGVQQWQLALMFFFLWVAQTLEFTVLRLRSNKPSTRHMLETAFTSALIPPLSVYWRLVGAIKYRVFFL
jgi:GT2 family glycosyltransferase